MIIKIQLPLFTTEREPKALIYNNDRTFQEQIPVSHNLKVAMGDAKKAYFWAEIKDGVLHLIEKVKGEW